VAKAVRGDVLGQPGPTRQPRHDPGGVVAVQPASGIRHQQRAVGAAAERRLNCADSLWRQRHQSALATLAHYREDPMGALDAKVAHIGRARFGDSQPVQGE
jgi:hypothetical protein